MTKAKIALAIALGGAALVFVAQSATQPMTAPGVAGTQGSSNVAPRAPTLIACDQSVSRDLKGPGDFNLASAAGKNLYVCSYSISNGSALQDVQFVSGAEVADVSPGYSSGNSLAYPAGSGHVCLPGLAVTAKFHLLSNQFVSQGSGVGSLFVTTGQGLCLRVTGGGEVSVNVTYASY